MICEVCGNKIEAIPKGFFIIDGQAIIMCSCCCQTYSEEEMKENDVEKLYWKE